MGSKENARRGGFIFLIIVVALFSAANACFKIYTIVEAFKWLEDFLQLSGRYSNNWNWTVSILVLAFFEVFGNSGVTRYMSRSWSPEYRCQVMLSLFAVSVVELIITTPAWCAVRECHWAEVLRKAGHDDHAYHVGMFYSFGKAAIIFWSIIGFVRLVTLLCVVMSAESHRRGIRCFLDTYDQSEEHRSQSQADPDLEGGDDQKKRRASQD